MKKIKRTTILTLAAAFVGMATLGLASCVKEEDVNSAVNSSVDPVKTQIADINGTLDELKTTDKTLDEYIDALETKIAELEKERVEKNETDIADILEKLEQLKAENQIMKNCLNGEHVYGEITYKWKGSDCTAFHHCDHCDGAFTEAGKVLDFDGYKEATFEYELFEEQLWGKIENAVIDGVSISAEEIKETVTYILTKGGRNVHVKLAKDASYEELYAIRRAIADHEDVKNESVHLTLAGIEVFPDHDDVNPTQMTFGHDEFGLSFTELSTVTLPDAVEVGKRSFYDAKVSKLIAPNLERVGAFAFSVTNLTEVDLPKLKTTENFSFSTSTIKTVKLPSLNSLGENTFWSSSQIERVELTAKGDITVGDDAFNPSKTSNMDLVLAGDKGHQVSDNTWTTKQPNGTPISFTFKSITYVGATIDVETNTYYVSSAEELAEWNEAAQSDLTANLVLEEDIVLTGENNWTLIGSYENKYSGTVNGAGHSITGLHMDDTKSVAMISYLHTNGVVKDLTLIDATFRVTVYGSRSAIASTIVLSNSGIVSNCHVQGNSIVRAISESQGYAGGIVHSNLGEGTIIGCSNEAAVSAYDCAGGIASSNSGSIENCVNRGSINSYYAGGIAGSSTNRGIVKACINTGAISGSYYAGGIVGDLSSSAVIVACGNIGTVTGSYSVGGIIGAQSSYGAPKVIGSWTVETQEYSDRMEVAVGKNGVGKEYFPKDITACYVGDEAAITAAIEVMNSEIASYGYKWVAGENGAYPTLLVLENS